MARMATRRRQLGITTDLVNVTSLNATVPDEQWRYVDGHGHGHFYAAEGPHYPTLHEVTHVEWFDDGDGRGDEVTVHDYYECPHCKERIVTGTRYSGGMHSIPGMKRYTIDDEEVDRDTFVVAWREEAVARLDEQEADL